ncbi:hypothetical protein [Treponema sp. OMZ 792]|uniref:hypothetical protein n=2 Tax=Treponema TaxID=157 RepID=UPI0020A43A26|nr:hypothetical protein [Treponema sp. OMZ 792]
MLVSVNIFAESNDLSNGNGNGGKNKIGAWLGFPFIGLSYSHEFNDLIELDVLVGITGLPFISRQINFRTGLLFTVWEPVINVEKCPLTIGPAIDINSFMLLILPASLGVTLLSPIRWEVNFRSAPSFNLFIEAAPAIGFSYALPYTHGTGMVISLQNMQINDKVSIHWIPHIGLGLRYRIPNKK